MKPVKESGREMVEAEFGCGGYRRPFCVAWAQLPLRKASGE